MGKIKIKITLQVILLAILYGFTLFIVRYDVDLVELSHNFINNFNKGV